MRTFDFSPLFRSSVGFDRMMDWLQSAAQLDDADINYPPYNIEKTGDDDYRITMAVAGFNPDDITVEAKENTLLVSGERKADEGDHTYLYRGIAGRSFRRTFQLADYVKVKGAHLENGLLHIELVREVPEAMRPRRIPIATGDRAWIGSERPRLVEKEEVAA